MDSMGRALAGVCFWAAVSASVPLQAQGYAGVVPGAALTPGNIAAKPGAGALVTWPGFQMLPSGGSRVFIQTSVAVTAELKREGRDYVILLQGVTLPAGNARLPLDTHFFNTPVVSVKTKMAKRRGVLVRLEMRSNVVPVVRTERSSTGYFFTFLEFPPGDYR
jgi:hypothetical protein